MAHTRKNKNRQSKDSIEDEPGAEERFMRGIRTALTTPPKTHDEMVKERRTKRKKK